MGSLYWIRLSSHEDSRFWLYSFGEVVMADLDRHDKFIESPAGQELKKKFHNETMAEMGSLLLWRRTWLPRHRCLIALPIS